MVAIHQNKLNIFLIIGLGNIGSRHLESLLKVKNSQIYIYDNSKEKITQTLEKYKNKKIKKLNRLKDLKKSIDFVVIATNADTRHEVLSNLVKNCNPKYVLLEKVVFQKLTYFKKFIKISKIKKIKFLINYPRRLWGFFHSIKNEIKKSQSNFQIEFRGQNWGLCCNTIHFIDLLFFLSFKKINNVHHISFLNRKIIKSKRKNFYELKGKINYECNNGNRLVVIDKKNEKPVLVINSKIFMYYIKFDTNFYYVNKTKNFDNSFKKVFKIKIPKQSEITKDYLKLIKLRKTNLLCDLNESQKHHKALFNSIEESFKFSNKFNKKKFPIT